MGSYKTLIAAVVCFLLTLAVPTVAFTVGEDPASNNVTLESANNRYASVENGELQIDFEKLNDRAITRAGDIFTISVTADDVERVWIENDVPGLTFYKGSNPSTTISESNPLEPSAGTTTSVGVAIDTHEAVNETETFTVVVEYEEDDTESDILGSNLSVSPTTVETGETVAVSATYRNEGDGWGTERVALTVDGTVVDRRTIALSSGDEQTVTFEREMQWSGTYEVGIEGVGTETVTVEPVDGGEGQAPEDDRIAVSNATVTSTTIADGEATMIEATVRNPTDRAIERTLELSVDGTVVDTRTVTVPANGERTVAFQRSFDEPGTYEVAVSGVSAGTVTVKQSAFSIHNRELAPATTVALAPPATAGLLFLAIAANRRWEFVR